MLARARELALRAAGATSPNPIVGCVVAQGATIVGEGWHHGPGLPHAEVNALGVAGERARGATLVCTLEPCSHHGRTAPCTDAILASGVSRVVIGALDPLERGRDGGADVLRRAGVDVALAPAEDERRCREDNDAFVTWAVTGRPLVTLKLATSLDGKIATATGESRWITGAASRQVVHRMRAEHDGVMVGIGTALIDDPALTARDVGVARQPKRIVVDSRARLPVSSLLARTARETPVVLLTTEQAATRDRSALGALGVDVVVCGPGPRVDLPRALDALGSGGVQSVLVEGGAALAGALVAGGHVDRVAWFLAPFLIGGGDAPGAVGGAGLNRLAEATPLTGLSVRPIGGDVLITGRLRPVAECSPAS